MLKVEEKQQMAPQSPPEKGSPKKSGPAPKPSRGASRLRSRVQAKVNTGLKRRGKDLEETKRNIGGARSDQDLAERSKVTGKVMPPTRQTKGKENVPSKSRVEPKVTIQYRMNQLCCTPTGLVAPGIFLPNSNYSRMLLDTIIQ